MHKELVLSLVKELGSHMVKIKKTKQNKTEKWLDFEYNRISWLFKFKTSNIKQISKAKSSFFFFLLFYLSFYFDRST